MRLWIYLEKTTREVEGYYVVFGYLLVVGYLGFYIFNLSIAGLASYESLFMRVVVASLGLGLIFYKKWPPGLRKYMPVYWYATLIYSLPFFFLYMLFSNPNSSIWQINCLVGLITLTFFVDWIAYIILLLIGALLAYIAFYVSNDIPHLPSSLISVFGSYSAPVIYLVLFSQKRREIYQDLLLVEEKAFNARLVKQAAELQKALIIKTDFLNNLSHEVRTPISGVVNISELLLDHWHEYTEQERYKCMQNVTSSANRLLMVMNSILDLSKFTVGKMVMDVKKSNIKDVINDMVEECKVLYLNQSTSLTIEADIQPNLNGNILIDKERISQVLRNLVGNAIKYSKEGKITISLRKMVKNIEIIVSDQGVGIPEEELEDIFSPFVQSSRTKKISGSTGLGLSICREIIGAHHGKIWAENGYNGGAQFHILLPQNFEENQKNIENLHNNSKGKGRILMIDDDSICHSIVSMILKNEGYDMISTYGGIEGLEYIKSHRDEIDLILLDLMMPDIYGLNVLQEIKLNPDLKDIPVIIQSASNDMSERRKALDSGATNFFRKPYDRKAIVQVLAELLSDKKNPKS